MARDLAGRAEGASLTLSNLDLGAAMRGQYGGLQGVGRRTLGAVVMKILHQEQMKLDNHRCPDDQLAIPSRSAETSGQNCSTPLIPRGLPINRIAP